MTNHLKIFSAVLILSVLFSIFGKEDAFFSDPSFYLRLIHADRLHEQGLTGKGVTIAVIDEGFEDHHPFLKSRLASTRYNTDNHGENIAETLVYRNGEFIFENHGTHVSSIIMSTDPRWRGIAKDSELLPVKLGEYHGDQAIVRALDYVAQSKARIVNLSFALSFTGRAISPNVRKALERLAQEDKLIVIAAGNEGRPLIRSSYGHSLVDLAASPAVGGRVLLVGAYESPLFQEEKRAPFSNFPGTKEGGRFFVSAPGVHIEAAFAEHKTGKLSGTSMAAPMVCGVAALLMEGFPTYSTQKIASLVLNGARKVDHKGQVLSPEIWGQGLLDAVGAYTQGLENART